jgi:hypothetical protein
MTREALVCLLLLAAVCWTVANDHGIPEARPITADAPVTPTPDWQAIAIYNRDMANRCWATVRYYQRPRTFLPLALRGR